MENKGWKEFRFSDFVEINPVVALRANEEYSFVEMKDLEDGNKYCFPKTKKIKGGGAKFQNGDTLFARITPCLENGKICQVRGLENNLGFGSTEFYVFRGKIDTSDTEFVYYLSRWDDVRSHAEINLDGSSGRQRVPKACFGDLVISLPPLPEQKAIASVLSSLDDKIDLLHQQNQTLEALAETLYLNFMGDKELNSKLIDVFSLQNGYAFKSKSFNGSGTIRVIKIKNISGDVVDITNSDFVDNESIKKLDVKFKINSGDILIAMTGAEVGKLGIVPETDQSLWLNQRVGLLKEKFRGAKWLAYLHLKSDFGQDYIGNTSTGSAQPNISGEGIQNCGFPYFDETELKNFCNTLSALYDKVVFNLGQVQTLTNLRDTLLPNLMSGEISMKMWFVKNN